MLKANTDQSWMWRIIDFINPLRDPSLTVAVVLTIVEEVGQHDPWYLLIVFGLVNWLAVRGVVWLIVNFTFATTFISRRVWWALKHPRLAWRILDAVGHEEIVIGGLPSMPEGLLLPDGTSIMNMGGTGMHVLGELPAGTEVPMLGMPNGQMTPDIASLTGNSGFFAGASGMFPGMQQFGQQMQGFQQNAMPGTQTTDGLPQSFPQRPSYEEERMRQQMASYIRLLEDWIQFSEEKWRTVSDSQLGWKPLRGRYGSWDDIFQDTYAAKTSDPMAQAAQAAGEANARRFDSSRDKGSAASAVACFLRDMMTLRRGLEMLQSTLEQAPETSSMQSVPSSSSTQFNANSGPLRNGSSPGRSTLIRRPAQIFVDADTDK
ncbi:MAG: hypothetical protein M3Z08_21865 [Chloroflexota bacterium]|nr:hypothetical protein [Chloroflexota bacterium]